MEDNPTPEREVLRLESESETSLSTVDQDVLNEILPDDLEKNKVHHPNDLNDAGFSNLQSNVEYTKMGDSDDDEEADLEEDGEKNKRIELGGEKSEVKRVNKRLKGNIYKKENGMLECTKCEKKCVTHTSLVNHYQTVHLQKRYKCDTCNEAVYKYPTSLSAHKRKCSGIGEKRFRCELCGEAFSVKIRLSAHQSQIHKFFPEKRFTCEICGKIFLHENSLKDHEQVVYFGKRFCCRFCGKPHFSQGNASRHEKKCSNKNK